MGRILWALCVTLLLLMGFTATARADDSAVRVCIKPDVPPGIDAWAYDAKGTMVVRMKRDDFKKKSKGRTVYLYSPSAPPESVLLLPERYHHLTCPPAPKPNVPPPPPGAPSGPPPPPGAGATIELPKPADKPPSDEKKLEPPEPLPKLIIYADKPPPPDALPLPPPGGVTEQWTQTVLPIKRYEPGETHVLPVVNRDSTDKLPMTHVLPMKGEKPGSGTGDGDGTGHGPKKTLGEKVAEELIFGAMIANGQFNEETKSPDGKKYGIPGGKNPNGPNNPYAQAAAGAVLIGAALAAQNAEKLKKKLVESLARKTPLPYAEMAKLGEDVAEKIANEFGPKIEAELAKRGEKLFEGEGAKLAREAIAKQLSESGTLGPYEVMKQFTDKLGGQYQAHHILEKQFATKFGLGNADKVPSVILTDVQHKAITAKLAKKTPFATSPQKLWAIYQEVYKDAPSWLTAIEGYFKNAK